jgi:hypothetical protein
MLSDAFMKNALYLVIAFSAVVALGGCAEKDMVLSNQGFQELSRGNNEEAGMKLEEALAVNPNNPYARLNLGVVYHRTGRPEKARRMYEKVIALQPQDKAGTSNVSSFSGASLAEIAEANLKLLEENSPEPPTPVSEPLSTPAAGSPPQEQAGIAQQDPPSKEPVRESTAEPEAFLYTVRESGTLLEIAQRPDVYGDALKWPALFRHNMNKFQSAADLLSQPVPRGTRLRVVTPDRASKESATADERFWVVNAATVRTLDRTAPLATALMRRGYRVYLMKTELAGEQWIRLRVGFYPTILEAMAVCNQIRPLMPDSGEPCVSKIDAEEFEKNAGY